MMRPGVGGLVCWGAGTRVSKLGRVWAGGGVLVRARVRGRRRLLRWHSTPRVHTLLSLAQCPQGGYRAKSMPLLLPAISSPTPLPNLPPQPPSPIPLPKLPPQSPSPPPSSPPPRRDWATASGRSAPARARAWRRACTRWVGGWVGGVGAGGAQGGAQGGGGGAGVGEACSCVLLGAAWCR